MLYPQAMSANQIFALEASEKNAQLILLPVPFEATTSYLGGTSKGPENVFEASAQVDLFHKMAPEAYEKGFFMKDISPQIKSWNEEASALAKKSRVGDAAATKKVNVISNQLNDWVYQEIKAVIELNKVAGLIGGDHSVPYGAIKAHTEKYSDLGILHFDAHMDLREAYEGFEHSHASIMYNVIEDLPVRSMTAVGVRDFSREEYDYSEKHRKHYYFSGEELFRRKAEGQHWRNVCRDIVHTLPEHVYVSFDIDGLDPHLCPGTGTPVPGGLSYMEAVSILRVLSYSGKRIVGFDLCEVGPGTFDGNIGARILYELCVLSVTDPKEVRL